MSKLDGVQKLIKIIVYETLCDDIALYDKLKKRLLPASIYYPIGDNDEKNYNLPSILAGRIKSLQGIRLAIEEGKSIQEIAQTKLEKMYQSLHRFFKAETPISPITREEPLLWIKK